MTSPSDPITVEERGHVFLIGLGRPDKRNAFSLRMLDGLARAYARFEDTDSARCAVLFAHGEHFTAGLDLREVGPAVAKGAALVPPGGLDPLDLFGRRRTKPLVCAVQGYCLTIGVELMLASDIRIAASDTIFAQMEVQRGIMAFGGATIRLPLAAGWGNAMRWLLTGDRFDAAEALRIGLAQEIVAPGEQLARAVAIAERVAAQAPLAVRATLASARLAVERGPAVALEGLKAEARGLMHTADALEGVRSFAERRAGRFEGR
ncbi:MAG: enoyl-CoA hydratase [Deltaproteobacteria bacterium HGW-Deltaproteobacteria-14]|nr:MAG: enoyl-CoA hydratase [Deltaproteobacteria bacterium HGW-Deltaproteobacteria-14]